MEIFKMIIGHAVTIAFSLGFVFLVLTVLKNRDKRIEQERAIAEMVKTRNSNVDLNNKNWRLIESNFCKIREHFRKEVNSVIKTDNDNWLEQIDVNQTLDENRIKHEKALNSLLSLISNFDLKEPDQEKVLEINQILDGDA